MTRCDECEMLGFHLGRCSKRAGNDAINPSHYRHCSGVEAIDVSRSMTYVVGNAFTYVFRHLEKGQPLQDLTKARWYVADAVNHRDLIFASYVDRIEAAILLTKIWEAEPHNGSKAFYGALLDMDLIAAGFVVEAMMRDYADE